MTIPARGDAAPLPLFDAMSRPRMSAVRRVRRGLLAWFAANARDIPFRRSRDPYAVLVAEVMAQQTQIARVEPSWQRFMRRFPTVAALAAASPGDVVRAWAGLGYNRRAVGLHRAARIVVSDCAGRFPSTVDELQALPGVGPYTARAVAATAFGVPVAGVDTNVRRVLTRVLGTDAAARDVQRAADVLVDRTRPAEWTHALMDVGATVCRPRAPDCESCPLQRYCIARAHGSVDAPRERRRRGVVPPFEQTQRWLRGRIVARLVAAEGARWQHIRGPLGVHDSQSVATALDALAADGVIERDQRGRVRLPTHA